MNQFKIFIILFFISSIFMSCDEKEIVIPDVDVVASDRVVLIEDFSGVQCVNCPNAGRAIEAIMLDHPENVIAITNYTNELGDPYPESNCDLRVEDAISIQGDLGVLLAKPAGVFNRVYLDANDRFNLSPNTWENIVLEQLGNAPLANLSIEHTYDAASRTVSAKVTATAVKDISEAVRISLCITENDVVDVQLDVDGRDFDYKHKHVLRDYITPFDGESFASSMSKNELKQKTFEFQIPTEVGSITANSCPVNVDNCSIVAFIHFGSADNKEVIQATEAHVIE